ncbi:MAG: M57 family metalloprotease [Bacteroidia bacterium]
MKKLLYISVLAFLFSCSKEKEINNLQQPDTSLGLAKYIPMLKKMGYSTKDLIDYGNSVVVEGDIAITKQYLDSVSKSINNKQTMWSTAYLTRSAVSNITVYTNGSLPNEWTLAIQEAVTKWTNLTGSVITINFSSGSSGTILVTSDYGFMTSGDAVSGNPTNPNTPYPQININADNRPTTHLQKVYILVHELGHCIGFRHTNWATNVNPSTGQVGESQSLNGGYAWDIHHGTPTSDPNSVMNSGNITINDSWTNFSQYDILATELIYPQWNDYIQLGGAVWPNTFVMTNLNGYVYVVQYDKLYRITPSNGAYTQIGPSVWTGTEGITSLNNYIYIVENSRLYRVDPNNGTYVQLGGAVWAGTEAMCSLNGYIYIVQNSRLYKVDPSNGTYVQLGGASWTGTYDMCTLGGFLYIVENSRLYKVDPNNGSYIQLGGAIWLNANGITANTTNNMLYIVQNDLYYKVSPTTGVHTRLGGIAWNNTNSMTSIAGYNYLIQNSRFYRIGIN